MFTPDPRVVDAHCHLWARSHQQRSWPEAPGLFARSFTVDDLERSCAASGVASVVLIEAGTSNREAGLLEANAAAAHFIGAFIAFADATSGGFERHLDRLMLQPKFRGVRMRFEGRASIDPSTPAVIRSAREIARRGLVLELLVSTEQLVAVRELAEAVPDLRGIIDHMAKPYLADEHEYVRWRGLVRHIADDTQLHFKMSLSPRAIDLPHLAQHPEEAWPAERVRPYLETLIEVVGPSRLAWGSDWPIGVFGADQGAAIQAIRGALGLMDGATSDLIFSSTAKTFYGLA